MAYVNVRPRQMIHECQFLEKNYLQCILQKALKDNVKTNTCNIEQIWYFHTECPDYIKKYDDPVEGPAFLKKQMFNMLSYPYYNFRENKAGEKPQPKDLQRAYRYLEYPEMNIPKNKAGSEVNLLFDKDLRKEFSSGFDYKADAKADE